MRALDISASGLEAQRIRMEVASHNLANVQTTRASKGADGSWMPYRRKQVVFRPLLEQALGSAGSRVAGVQVERITEDPSDFRLQHDPAHPDADEQGNVRMPNVDPLMEMVDLMEASRAYEAGVTAMDSAKTMAVAALRLLA